MTLDRTRAMMARAFVALVLSVAISVELTAQQRDDAGEVGPTVRLGGITLTRSIDFTTGIDTNVFNSAEHPLTDMMWTLTPGATAALRLGPARVSGKTSADFAFYVRSASERSVNFSTTVTAAVPLNRVRAYVSAWFLNTRERPSYEVDARSRRHQRGASGGVSVRLSGKTSVEIAASTSTIEFDESALYFNTYLRDTFNRATSTIGASGRYALTPLTTVTMSVASSSERFEFAPARNSRSIRMVPGIEFASSALVTGKAAVGYRSFDARDSSVPDFSGAVASAELTYTLRGSTRFTLRTNRDVEYSYDVTSPYYVLSGMGGAVEQQLTNSIGISARSDRYQLAYRALLTATSRRPGDAFFVNGIGLLWKAGRDLQVNAHVDYYHRSTLQTTRTFSSVRGSMSVGYRF